MNMEHIDIDLGEIKQGVSGHVNLQILEYSPKFLTKHKKTFNEIEKLTVEIEKLGKQFDVAYAAGNESYVSFQQTLGEQSSKLAKLKSSLPRMTAKNSHVVKDLGWKNLITNTGLDLLGQGTAYANVFTRCAVGTGNSTPIITQTKLDSQPASATTGTYLTSGGGVGTSYPNTSTTVLKRTFDFALGALAGTFAEVGFTNSAAADPFLFSRSLIQSAGVPTAVTVLVSQQLRVVYTLTVIVGPLTARRVVPEISGYTIFTASTPTTASQTATTITSSAAIFTAGMVNHAVKFADNSFAIILTFNSSVSVGVDRSQTVASQTFSILSGTTGAEILQNLSGLIGSIDSGGNGYIGSLEPAGSSGYGGNIPAFVSSNSAALPTAGTGVNRSTPLSTNATAVAAVYNLGTFYKDFTMSFSVNDANHAIRSLGLGSASTPSLTTLFDVDQPKTNLFTLSITFRLTWTRN